MVEVETGLRCNILERNGRQILKKCDRFSRRRLVMRRSHSRLTERPAINRQDKCRKASPWSSSWANFPAGKGAQEELLGCRHWGTSPGTAGLHSQECLLL